MNLKTIVCDFEDCNEYFAYFYNENDLVIELGTRFYCKKHYKEVKE